MEYLYLKSKNCCPILPQPTTAKLIFLFLLCINWKYLWNNFYLSGIIVLRIAKGDYMGALEIIAVVAVVYFFLIKWYIEYIYTLFKIKIKFKLISN